MSIHIIFGIYLSQLMIIIQVLNDRIESLGRQLQEMEGRNQSLQLTVDRLSLSLAKTEEEESNQKVNGQ